VQPVASQEVRVAPAPSVGERWIYSVHDGHWGDGTFTIEISEKSSSGYSITTKDVTTRVMTVPSALTLDLNWVRTLPSGPAASCWLSFPLAVGRTWTCKTPWVSTRGHNGEDDFVYKVVGAEKITVAAGSFDTIKVVGEGRWKNLSLGGSDLSTVTVWFSNDARGIVQYQRVNWPKVPNNPQIRLELMRHEVPK
jgi:hypothetical protein